MSRKSSRAKRHAMSFVPQPSAIPYDNVDPDPAPGQIWVEDYRDRLLVPSGQAFTPLDLLGFIQLAEQGDTRYLYAFYDDMRARDAHLDGELGKAEDYLVGARINVLVPRQLRSAKQKKSRLGKRAQDISDYVEEQLFAPSVRLDQAIRCLSDGLWKGAAGVEVEVKPGGSTGGRESLTTLRPIPSQRFRYLPTTTTLVLQQNAQMDHWVEIQELGDRIAMLQAEQEVPSPARRGLLRRCMGLWMLRLYGPQWWGRFVELFGSPMRIGHFAPGDVNSEAKMIQALKTMGSAAWAALPTGADITFAASAQAINQPPHELLLEWAAREISKVVLGATQTADVQRNTGSRASAQVHHDVTIARSFSRGLEVASCIREQIVKPLVRRNFGELEAETMTPELKIRVEPRPDIFNASQGLKHLQDAGMKTIPESWVHDYLGIPTPDGDEPCLVLPLLPGSPLAPGFGAKPAGPNETVPKPEINAPPSGAAASGGG